MVVELKDIASVQMGYSFRTGLGFWGEQNGVVGVIQMKDLGEDNVVNCADLMRTGDKGVSERHMVKKGDLVFRSRGLVATAAIVRDDPGQVILASPLLRIRVLRRAQVLPEYLRWYIGQRDAQVYLASRSKGTAQKMISVNAIEHLPVQLPDLAVQQSIVEIAGLAERESVLLRSLMEKRQQFISTRLVSYAGGAA